MPENYTSATLGLGIDTKQFNKELSSTSLRTEAALQVMKRNADSFNASWKDLTAGIKDTKRIVSGIVISQGFYLLTGTLVQGAAAALDFSSNMEQAAISMEYFVSGADKANKAAAFLREMNEFAARTPFSTEEALSLSKYMQSVGVAMDTTKSFLQVVTDTAAATGATEENMQRIIYALGQMMTKGRIAAEEIRQLANANVPVYDILQEELGLTGQQIANIGKMWVSADKGVVAILRGLDKRYKGAADKIADTFGGMTETIKDDLRIISQEAGSGLYTSLEGAVRRVRDLLDEWRDVATEKGSMGLFEHIMEDIDKSGELRNEILMLIGNVENLIKSGTNLAAAARPILQIYGKSMYVAFNTSAAALTSISNAAQDVLKFFNKLGITSDMLVNTIGRLYVAYTAARWLGTLGQAGFAAANSMVITAKGIYSLLPASVQAQSGIIGLTTSVLGLVGVLALAYQMFTAFSGAASGIEISGGGVSQEYLDAYDDYLRRMEEYNAAIAQYQEDFNKPYESIEDGTQKAEDGLEDVKDASKKAAKSVMNDWVASFDEVYAVPSEKAADAGTGDKDDELKLPDLGALLIPPRYVFPSIDSDALEKPIFDWPSVLDDMPTTNWLEKVLPGIIAAGMLGGLGNFFSKKGPLTDIEAKRPPKLDSTSSLKDINNKLGELGTKLDDLKSITDDHLKALQHAVEMDQKYVTGGPDAKAIEGATEQLKLNAAELRKALKEFNEVRALKGEAPLDMDSYLAQLDRTINEGTLTAIDRKLDALKAMQKQQGLDFATIQNIDNQVKALTAQREKIVAQTGEVGVGNLDYKALVAKLDEATPRLYKAFEGFQGSLNRIEGIRIIDTATAKELKAAIDEFTAISNQLNKFVEHASHMPTTPGLAALDEFTKLESTIKQALNTLLKKNGETLDGLVEKITHLYNNNLSREAQRQLLESTQYRQMSKAYDTLNDVAYRMQENSLEALENQAKIIKNQQDAAKASAERQAAAEAQRNAQLEALKQQRADGIAHDAAKPVATDQSVTQRMMDEMTLEGRRVEDVLTQIESKVEKLDTKALKTTINELVEEIRMAKDTMQLIVDENNGIIPTLGTAPQGRVDMYVKALDEYNLGLVSLKEQIELASENGVELSARTRRIVAQLDALTTGQDGITTAAQNMYKALQQAAKSNLGSSELLKTAAEAVSATGKIDAGLQQLLDIVGLQKGSFYLTGTSTETALKGIGSFDSSIVSDIARRLTDLGVRNLDRLFLTATEENLRIIAVLGNELESIVGSLANTRMSKLQGSILQGGYAASDKFPAVAQIDSVLKLWDETGKAFALIPNDIKTKGARDAQALLDAVGEIKGTVKTIRADVLKAIAPANYYQFAMQAATNGTNSVGMSVFNRDFDFPDSNMVRRWQQLMGRQGLTNPYGNKMFSADAIRAWGASRSFDSIEDMVKGYMRDVITPALMDGSNLIDFGPLADAYQQYIVQYTADELKALKLDKLSKAYSQYGQLITVMSNNNNLSDFLTEWVRLDNGIQEATAAINFTPVARHYRKMVNGHNKWVQDILQTEISFSRGAIGRPLKVAVDKLVREYNEAVKVAGNFDDVANAVAGFKDGLKKLSDAADTFARGGELEASYKAIFEGTQRSMEDMQLLRRALTKISNNTTLVSDIPRMMRTTVDQITQINAKLASGEAMQLYDLRSAANTMEQLFDSLGLNTSMAVRQTMQQLETMIQVTQRYGDKVVLSTKNFKPLELPFSILDIDQSLKYTAGAIKDAVDKGILKVADEMAPAYERLMAEIGPEIVENSFIGQLRKAAKELPTWVIDLETTGMPLQGVGGIQNPQIAQVGLYNTETGKLYNWFVNWGTENTDILRRMQSILPAWESVSVEQLNNAKSIYEVLGEVKQLVGDASLTGFNATNFSHAGGAFDARIIEALMPNSFNWGEDVMATALDDIRKAFGLNTHIKNIDLAQMLLGSLPEGAHLANIDAQMTGDALKAIVAGKLDEIIELARPAVEAGTPVRDALFAASDTVFNRAANGAGNLADAAGDVAKNADAAQEVIEQIIKNASAGMDETSSASKVFSEAMDLGRRKMHTFTEAMKDFWGNGSKVDDLAEGPVASIFKNWVTKLRDSLSGIGFSSEVIDTTKLLKMYEGLLDANEAFIPFKQQYAAAFQKFIMEAADSTDVAIGKAVQHLQDVLPNYQAASIAYDRAISQVASGTLSTADSNFKTAVKQFAKAQKDYDNAMAKIAKAMENSSDSSIAQIAKDYAKAHGQFSEISETFYKDLLNLTQRGMKQTDNLGNVFRVAAELMNDDTLEGGFKYLAYTMDPKTGAIKLLNDSLTTTGKEIENAFMEAAQSALRASGSTEITADMIRSALLNIAKAADEAGGDMVKLLSLADEFDDVTKAVFNAYRQVGNTTVILDAAGNIKYAGEAVQEAFEAMSSISSRAAKALNKAIVGWNNFGIFDVAAIAIGTGMQYAEDTSREKQMSQRMLAFDTTGFANELYESGIDIGKMLGDALYNGTLAAFGQETVTAMIGAGVTTAIVAATGGTAGIAFLGASLLGAAASIGSDVLMRATGSRSDSALYLDDYIKAISDGTLMTEGMYKEIEESLGRVLTDAERSDIERTARDALNQDLILGAKRNIWSNSNINQVLYGTDGGAYGAAKETALTIRSAAALGTLDYKALGIGSMDFENPYADATMIDADQLVVKDIKGLKALEDLLGRQLKMGESATNAAGETVYRVQYADTGYNVGTVSFDNLAALEEAFTTMYRGGGESGAILEEIKNTVGQNAAVNSAALQRYGYGAALAEQNFDLLLDMYNSINESNYSREELEANGGSAKLQQQGAAIFDAFYQRAMSQIGVAGDQTFNKANISNLLDPNATATAGSVQAVAFGADLSGVMKSVLDDLAKQGITLTEGKYSYTSELTGEATESYVTVNVDLDELKDEVRGWTVKPENIDLTGMTLSSDDISILASMGIQIDAQNGTIDFMRPINEEVMGADRKLTLNAGDFSQSVIESLEAYHFKLNFEAGELNIDNWDKVKDNMYGAMFKIPDSMKRSLNGEAEQVLQGIGTIMDSGYLMITNQAILNGSMTIEEYVASIADGEKKLSPEIMQALQNIDELILQGGEDTKQAIIEWANGIVVPSPLDEDQISEELRESFAAIGINFQKYGDEFLMVINQTGDHIKDGMVLIDKEKWNNLDQEIKDALASLGVTMTTEGNNILVDLNGTFANGIDDLVAVWVEQPDKWQQLPDTVKQWLMETGVVTADELVKLTMITNQGLTELSDGWLISLGLLDQSTQDAMRKIFTDQGKECTDGFALVKSVVDGANIPELLDDEIVVPFSELPDAIKDSLGSAATNMNDKYVIMQNSTSDATGELLRAWTNTNTNVTNQANQMADNIAAAVTRALQEAERASNIKVGSSGGFMGIGSTKNTIGDAKTIKVNGAQYTGYPEYDKDGNLVQWHYYDSTGKEKTTKTATVVGRAKGGKVDEDYTIVGEEGQEMAILPGGKLRLVGKNGPEMYDLPHGTQIINNEDTQDVMKYVGNGATVRKLADGNTEVELAGADEETNKSLTDMVAAILHILQYGTTLDESKGSDGVLDPNYESIGLETQYIVDSVEIAINGAVAAIIEAMYSETSSIIERLNNNEAADTSATLDDISSILNDGFNEVNSLLSSFDIPAPLDYSGALSEMYAELANINIEVTNIRVGLEALFDELKNSVLEVKTATDELSTAQLSTQDDLTYEELLEIAAEIVAAREAYQNATSDAERAAAHDAAEAARARAGYSGGANGDQVIGKDTYVEMINTLVARLIEMQGSMTLSEATTALLNEYSTQSATMVVDNATANTENMVETAQSEGNDTRQTMNATATMVSDNNTAAHRQTESVVSTEANSTRSVLSSAFSGLQDALAAGLRNIADSVSAGLDRAASLGYSNGYSNGYAAGSASGSNLGSGSGVTQKFAGSTTIKSNARGGLIKMDTLIRAGEFGRNEAVIPLEQPSIMEDVGATIGSYVDTETPDNLGEYVDYIVTSMEIAINGAVAALTEDRYSVNSMLSETIGQFNDTLDGLKSEISNPLNDISSDIGNLSSSIDSLQSTNSTGFDNIAKAIIEASGIVGSNNEAAQMVVDALEVLPDTLAAIIAEAQMQASYTTSYDSSSGGLSYDELVGIASDIARAQAMYANATTDEERAQAHQLAESARARAGYSGGENGSQVIGDNTYVELINNIVNALTLLQESMNLSDATLAVLNDANLQNSLNEIDNALQRAEYMAEVINQDGEETRRNETETSTAIRTDNTNAHKQTTQQITTTNIAQHRATEQVISTAANELKGVLTSNFAALQTALSNGLNTIAATVSAGLDRAAAYGYSNGYSNGYAAGAASASSNLGGGSKTIKSNARGGLIKEDTLIRAGEFGRSEAVIPLEQPSIMNDVGATIAAYVNGVDDNGGPVGNLGDYVDYIVTSMELAINGAVAALTEDKYSVNSMLTDTIGQFMDTMDGLKVELSGPLNDLSSEIGNLTSTAETIANNTNGIDSGFKEIGSNAEAAQLVVDALQTLPETMVALLEELYTVEMEAMTTPTMTVPNEAEMSQLEGIYQIAQEIAAARVAYQNATSDDERAAAHNAAEAARAKLGYSGGADGSAIPGNDELAILTESMATIIAQQLEPMTLSEVTTTLLNENSNINNELLMELITEMDTQQMERNDTAIQTLNDEQKRNNTQLITDHKSATVNTLNEHKLALMNSIQVHTYTMVNTINAIATTLSAQIAAGFQSVNATVAAGIDRAASIGFSNGYSAGYSAGAASAASNLGSKKGAALGGLVNQDALYRAGELNMSEAIIPLERPQVLKEVGEALGPYITVDQQRLMRAMLGVINGGIVTAETVRRPQPVQETPSVDNIVQRVLESVLPAMNNVDDNGEDRRPLYVGTLVADDRGLKELERKLYVIRQSEETRR